MFATDDASLYLLHLTSKKHSIKVERGYLQLRLIIISLFIIKPQLPSPKEMMIGLYIETEPFCGNIY